MVGSYNALPLVALSVRQPWAWAIIHAGKPVENRSWRKGNPGLKFRGLCCIHASQGMTRGEYEEAAEFMTSIGVTCPAAKDLQRGGIVGVTNIVDIVTELDSPWFFGPKGLILKESRAVEFAPSSGALGFFKWKRSGDGASEPAKWMGAGATHEGDTATANTQLDLL
ncbi:hypothetical protein PVA19_15165 [Agrobacterium sp. CNPSo 3708]|uniref:hypothetical protein n=1 Tax=Agrobacterium sp. CNPSo 3708 TaxID=3028150 RepID=UPI002363E66C|nr:hypothetical protein [Agrobacterium sp. CNPSo 3708]MDD1499761.1 hypothetical protein [Agrobacterium sp. CNPSo 3708]